MERARPKAIDFENLPAGVRTAPVGMPEPAGAAMRPVIETPAAPIPPMPPMTRPGPNRRARITAYEVYQLARMGCTLSEAAQFFGLKLSGLQSRIDREEELKLAWDRGTAQMKLGLRRLQLAHASRPGAPGVAMTIHMSKHQLDEVDKQEIKHVGGNDGPIEVTFNFDSPASKSLAAQAHGSSAE